MKIKILVMFFLLINLLYIPCGASNTDDYARKSFEASGAGELSEYLDDETEKYLELLGCEDARPEEILDISFGAIGKLLYGMLKNGFKEPLKDFIRAAGTVMLVSVCSGFVSDSEKNKIIINLISGGILSLSVFLSASESIKAAASAIEACTVFEKALIPVLTAVVSAGGSPTLAITYNSAAFASAEFISAFCSSFAFPLIGVSGALGTAGAMMPTVRLSSVSELIRKTFTGVLAAAVSLFSGFLGMKSIMASSADSLVKRGIRLASGMLVPVIGSSIGEAYSTFAGSLSILKNSIGIYAVIVIILICAPVIINLLLRIFSLRAACVLSEMLDCRVCSDVLKNISFVFSMINTVLLLCMTLTVISTGLIVAIKTGG